MTSNTPEYYNEVSLRLNRVLDTVGLNEDIRWKRINMWIQSEEMISLKIHGAIHYFGSQAEATTTPGLKSDVDIVCCPDITAVQDFRNWGPRHENVLVVSDENTPPGYVKLQGINNDQPLPIYNVSGGMYTLDRYGRSVLSHDSYYLESHVHGYHGPAVTTYFSNGLAHDRVLAVKHYAWPDQSYHWLTRKRRYNWPSQETIGLIQQTGALLVPVGHKLSQEQHLEWRVSISYGEKLLVWLFNSIQYKCYILLKMINKRFILPVVGDNVMSSYHLKTCMFYLIENTPAAIWQPDNLLRCVDMCLRLLYIWIEGKFCPNYFIPEENMFQCKMYGHIPGQLHNILSNLLRQEGRYLVWISCDNIGENLVIACQNRLLELEIPGENVAQVYLVSVEVMFAILGNIAEQIAKDYLYFEPRIINKIFVCQKPRREVNTILWKMLCSFKGSQLASESLSEEIPDQNALDIAQENLLWGSSSDVTSGKLKLAAYYFVQSYFEITEDVLNKIHENYSYKILDQKETYEYILHAILSEDLSTTQLISRYIALPVYYHPSEINCTPKALILEMFRSTGSNDLNSDDTFLPNTVSVDSKLYLYFLEFFCYHWQNKRLHKKVALGNMIYFIRHEKPEFEVTALNLLAYCLMQGGGSLVKAFNLLCKSMKLKNQHNAAKLQIAVIIKVVFNLLHGGQ